MVSADSLNLDVLELIVAHLDQHDLSQLCLVSRSFLAAAMPALYRSIGYHFSQSSDPALRVSLVRTSFVPVPRWVITLVQRASAFDTILLLPALAGHVRHICMFRRSLPLPSRSPRS
jgi:hypothetical protein